MTARMLILVMLLIFPLSQAQAADLYLVQIGSVEQLTAVKRVADHAHGAIDGRFLIELDSSAARRLAAQGIATEQIIRNYAGETLYLVAPENRHETKAPSGITPLFSFGNRHLARLDEPSRANLRAERFHVTPIGNTETPLFAPADMIPAPAPAGYPCDTLADLVSVDSLISYVLRLQAFYSRCVYSDSINAAGDWLQAKFREFGYDSIYEQWFTGTDHHDGGTVTAFNVICVKPGVKYPDKYIVIGAHYDSYQWYPKDWYHAPGADDNGSGTAAVLELARVLKDFDCDYTLIFSPFSAEEVGMVGSNFMAQQMHGRGDSVIFMLNYDVIGYNTSLNDSVYIFSGINNAFGRVFKEASQRVATMTPLWMTGMSSGVDDQSFYLQGYPTVGMFEWNYNFRMHRPQDSAIYVNFPYIGEIVRASAASLGIINKAPAPVFVKLTDIGDGQSLRLEITNGQPNYAHHIYYGPNPGGVTGTYADTNMLAPGIFQCEISGLVAGRKYYVAAAAVDEEGYGSIAMKEDTLTPLVIPRAPRNIVVNPDSLKVSVFWKANTELDFNYYRLLRRVGSSDWEMVADNLPDTVYMDADVAGHVTYSYAVQALDNDLNCSDTSQVRTVTPATFDRPLLLVDETLPDTYAPTEAKQTLFYNGILSGSSFDKISIDSAAVRLSRSKAGEYGAIFWSDDDNTGHYLNNSLDSLDWYLGYGVDMFVEGWQSVYGVTGPSYLYPGDFFYDHFGLSRVQINSQGQFAGADGEGDWPDLELITEAPIYGQMANITVFDAAPYGEVIYRFRSNVPGSYYDGKPVGVAYSTGFGKRVVLGFPLMYLTEAGAQGVVARVLAYFGEAETHYGDVNHDGRVNIQDITGLINYLYKNGAAPPVLSDADLNGDCAINIKDITYLIKFLYQNGPAPVAGCAS